MIAEWRAGIVAVKQLHLSLVDDEAYEEFIAEMNLMRF